MRFAQSFSFLDRVRSVSEYVHRDLTFVAPGEFQFGATRLGEIDFGTSEKFMNHRPAAVAMGRGGIMTIGRRFHDQKVTRQDLQPRVGSVSPDYDAARRAGSLSR